MINDILSIIGKAIPDTTEAMRIAHDLATFAEKQAHEQAMAQIKVNEEAAKSSSIYVSGARPTFIWIGALGFGYEFLFAPIANGLLAMFGYGAPFPSIDVFALGVAVFPLLGIGGMRTFEKMRGIARSNLTEPSVGKS